MQRQFGTEGNGATYTATQLATALSDRGNEVTVYGTEEPPTGTAEQRGVTLRTVSVPERPGPYRARFNGVIRDHISEFNEFDITHAYDMQLVPVMEEIATETASKVVVTLQAYSAICPKNDLLYRNREECTATGYVKCARCTLESLYQNEGRGVRGLPTAAKRASNRVRSLRMIRGARDDLDVIDGFHTYSDHMREAYASFGYQPDQIEVIRSLLDEAFLVDHRSDFEPPYNLLYVGRLATEKGVKHLIPMLARLRDTMEVDFTLTIAGNGYLRDSLEEAARTHHIEEAVDLVGHVPHAEMPALYASHDLFVYPGIWNEPFGRIFLEALATGTPIVATGVGANEEIIGDSGVIVETGVGGLVKGVERVVHEDAFSQLSSAATERSHAYRVDDVLPEFEAWYRSIIVGEGANRENVGAARGRSSKGT